MPAIDYADLYRRVWTHDAYRKYSPGEQDAPAHQLMRAFPPASDGGELVVHVAGCGTGRGALRLYNAGYAPVLSDVALPECLDGEVVGKLSPDAGVQYFDIDLTDSSSEIPEADVVYCCDVLEHIDERDLDDMLTRLRDRTRLGGVFQVCHVADGFGPSLVGKRLHLTIKKRAWWANRLAQIWPCVSYTEGAGPTTIFTVREKELTYGEQETHEEQRPAKASTQPRTDEATQSATATPPNVAFPPTGRARVAVLCPGPSLPLFPDAIAHQLYDTLIGINRAAIYAPCDFWCCLDSWIFRQISGVKGSPRKITRGSAVRSRAPELQNEDFIDADRLELRAPAGNFSATAAVGYAVEHLQAELIHVYGCDLAGTLDWDWFDDHGRPKEGCPLNDRPMRHERRWRSEKETWTKLRANYEARCQITFIREECDNAPVSP